jgi:hypothetical protein
VQPSKGQVFWTGKVYFRPGGGPQSVALGEFTFISSKAEAWVLPLWAQRSYLVMGELLSSKELGAKLTGITTAQQLMYMGHYKVQVAEAGLTMLEVRGAGVAVGE